MAAPGPEILTLQADVERRARESGLPVPEIRYEVVDHRELNEIAAYGGFPVRYPHWRFGMEYDRLIKGHTYGLQKIYELVVNTEPVVAYLLRQNSAVEQKLVMAHVCGHADFFRANAWFRHTDRNMLDVMASHGARIRTLADRHGRAEVRSPGVRGPPCRGADHDDRRRPVGRARVCLRPANRQREIIAFDRIYQ